MSGRKLRRREGPHAWWDKEVTRFIRENFEGKERVNLRHVYLAVCEIDSDFAERAKTKKVRIRNITKTCATYAGMDKSTVSKYLQKLRTLGFIDYGPERKANGTFGRTHLNLYEFEGNSSLSTDPELVNHRGKKTPKAVNSYQYKNNTKVLKPNKNESKDSKQNTPYSIGNSRSRTNPPLDKEVPLNLKIRLNRNKDCKLFDSNFESDRSGDYLGNYYTEEGFGKSDYSPLVRDKYSKLKSKGIPVDIKSLKAVTGCWNRFLEKNNKKIKARKGVSLSKHTLNKNKTLLHLQTSITYMTKIKGFNLAEMLTGTENFLNLYLNGHSYDKKANLVDALTTREDTFLKCIDGSIKKMPNFFPIAKEKKDLKYFIKLNLKELYAKNGGRRGIDPEEERAVRTYLAASRYESYLQYTTDLRIEQIARKIKEERELL